MRVTSLPVLLVLFTRGFLTGTAALIPSSTSPADERMHAWCDEMGIAINPSVRLLTTPTSVAGRGVFAIHPLEKEEVIASIPTYAMFHPGNAENMFPAVAAQLNERKNCPVDEPRRNWLQRLKRRIFRRKKKQTSIMEEAKEEERPWQAELTEFALAALREEHPLEPWIRQWNRNDPVQRLFEKGYPITQEEIQATADELHQMVPDLPVYKLLAALHIRIEQYESFAALLDEPNSPQTAAMFTTLCSRTLEVAEGITSVVPFHDMLNHAFEPNVGLAFSDDGRNLELLALHEIPAGEELCLCYTKIGKEYDEDTAVWMLVQWGIPVPRSEWKVAKAEGISTTAN